MPRRRNWTRMAWLEYALSARTLLGRVRGLPGPDLGKRTMDKASPNMTESPRCPGLVSMVTGRHRRSEARWILVVRPPRERPKVSRPSGSIRFNKPLFDHVRPEVPVVLRPRADVPGCWRNRCPPCAPARPRYRHRYARHRRSVATCHPVTSDDAGHTPISELP